ncbi:T9SS type B sorting domain-containing protein, partial [Flavihumibacter sp. R14]|nr:T9SS type B sorting domain-containing protein [Flavihumibacter soli]
TLTRSSTGSAAGATTATTYPIAATLADPDNKLANYTVTNTNGTLTVTQKALAIRATDRSKTYGDAVTFAGTEFTSTGLINGDAVNSITLNSAGAAATASVAGSTYSIVPSAATGSGLANYSISYTNGALSVSRKDLVIVNTDRSKTYGDVLANADFAGSITGIRNSDNISLMRSSMGSAAGATTATTYPIAATLADPDNKLANYNVTNTNGILTVNQKALAITATDRSKTYGDAVTFAGTEFSSTGLINGDAVTAVTLNSAGAAVTASVAGSAYSIVPSAATGSGLANYSISYINGALTVNRKDLVIVNTDRSKTYGEVLSNADFAGSITGIQNSDNITLTRSSTGSAAGATTATTYPIAATLSDPDNKLANYNVSNTNGTLTVTQKALAITATDRSKTYGDAVTFAGTEFTSTGLINGDAVNSITLNSAGAAATASVAGSTYSIVPSAASGSGLTNYSISYTNGALTVNRKDLVIVNTDRSKTYGDVLTNADFTGSITGIQNSDNITLTRSSTGSAAGATAATTYPIAATLADPDNKLANYNVSNTNGTLTVTQKALAITATDRSKTYGDAVTFAGTELTSTGLINGDAVNSITLNSAGAAATASVAGSAYSIVPSAATGSGLANYSISYTNGTLAVNKKELTITAENKTRFAGTANPVFTLSYSGFVNGEGQNIFSQQAGASTTADIASAIGEYPITLSPVSAANYQVIYRNGILKVVPGAPKSLSFAAAELFENASAGTLAGTLTSESDDPNALFSYTLVSGAGDTDNKLFTINGDKLSAATLDYEQKSTYSVRVSSATQHGFTLEKVVTIDLKDVNEAPTLAAVANQVVCYTSAPQQINLGGISAGPEGSRQSLNLSVSSSNTAMFAELKISNEGRLSYRVKEGMSGKATVTVTVRDNGGTDNGGVDTYSKDFTITVNPLPQITLSSDKGKSISKGETIRLTATGGRTYSWNNAGGVISGQQSATLILRPAATATYRVTVSTAEGCVSEQEITIEVKEDFKLVKGTNILSPNGDGVNDRFVIRNIDMYPNNTVKIFDRAGRMLFSKTNYTDEWEGTFQGSPLAEDTYYYIVDFGPGKMTLKGFITIVRE